MRTPLLYGLAAGALAALPIPISGILWMWPLGLLMLVHLSTRAGTARTVPVLLVGLAAVAVLPLGAILVAEPFFKALFVGGCFWGLGTAAERVLADR